MEISIRPDVFFQFIAIVCMRINLVDLPKQPFMVAETL